MWKMLHPITSVLNIKSSISLMDVSEQERASKGGRSQKKWLRTFELQKDNLNAQDVWIVESTKPIA